jgi:hypothetical protein
VDHLGFVVGESSGVLQVDQTFLDDLLDLVLGDEAEVFGAGDGDYLTGLLGVLILVEADEGPRLRVYAFDGLPPFADYQADQSHWHLQFDFVGPVHCSAVHLPLGLHDQVQLLSHSLD